MHNPCRRHHPVDSCPGVVQELDDALEVLAALQADYPDARSFALVMDHQRHGQLAIPIDGECPEDASGEFLAGRLIDVLGQALGHAPDGPLALVLGTRRPDANFTTDDARCWQRLRERCQAVPFDLLDWILVGESDFRSMSETCGPGWSPPTY
jgi:hypothetical protein